MRQQAWIFFHDESGFSQQPSVRTTWAPRGKTPILRPRGNPGSKTSVAAVPGFRWEGAQTRWFARTQPGSYHSTALMEFLKQRKRLVGGQKVILIWDHWPAHRRGHAGVPADPA
jgi:DDE superfamily endonuclease